MSLSQNPEYEKALILSNHLKEIEISNYLNGLDLADKLLVRDIYYLFCGGFESEEEKTISKILGEKR